MLSDAKPLELLERSNDLLTFVGILVNVLEAIHQSHVFVADFVRQLIGSSGERFERLAIPDLFRLRYLLIELADIAILLRLGLSPLIDSTSF